MGRDDGAAMSTTEAALKERIRELEAVLERALPVVRLTAYVKLAALIEATLQNKGTNSDRI